MQPRSHEDTKITKKNVFAGQRVGSSSWFRVFVIFVAKNVATMKDAEVVCSVPGCITQAHSYGSAAGGTPIMSRLLVRVRTPSIIG
jgi:hypothetical protein